VSVLRKADHDKTPELFLSCGFPSSACEVKLFDDDDHKKVLKGGFWVGRDRMVG
jgi:hypothetical protein